MLQKNTYSPFRKPELSSLHALFFISLVALILFISTTNVYSAQVTLAWDPNTEPDLAGHKIYSGSTSGNYDSNIDIGNRTSYTIPNVTEGQTYYFVVTAYDTFSNESGYSAEVAYTVPILDLTAPSTPTSLQAATISTSQINLSWNASSDNIGVTGYRIYRDSTQIATTSNTTYQDTGLSPSTTYSYTVSAYDAAGNVSGQSSASVATTLTLSGNNPPVLNTIANIIVNEGATVTLNPTATDPDEDTLTFSYTGWMISSSYTTDYNDSGIYTVTVTVSDGSLSDSQVVTIIVNDTTLIAKNITTGDMDGNGLQEVINYGPGHGIWILMNNSTWIQLHTLSPDTVTTGDIDGSGQDDVIIDYGPGHGIWILMNNSTWIKLHTLSPETVTTGDMDGNGLDDVIIDFGDPYGISVLMNNSALTSLVLN